MANTTLTTVNGATLTPPFIGFAGASAGVAGVVPAPPANASGVLKVLTDDGNWTTTSVGSSSFFPKEYAFLNTIGAAISSQFQNLTSVALSTMTVVLGTGSRYVFNNPASGTTPTNITSANISVVTSTGTYTINKAGTYKISVVIGDYFTTSNAQGYTQIVKNGATILAIKEWISGAANYFTNVIETIAVLAVGDTIDVRETSIVAGTSEPISLSIAFQQIL